MSTTDADQDFSGQDISVRVVLKAYRQMLVFLFLGASAFIVILVILIFVPYALQSKQGSPIPIFLVVVIAGTVGAFFSSLQRLYEFKQLPQILYDRQLGSEYGSLFVYSLIPAVVGSIAAAVLYLIFAGGMLSRPSPANRETAPISRHCSSTMVRRRRSTVPKPSSGDLWPALLNARSPISLIISCRMSTTTTTHRNAMGRVKTTAAAKPQRPRVTPVEEKPVDAGNDLAPTMASRGMANQT